MSTQTTDLVRFAGPGESLSDRLAAAAQARVLVDLVKDAQKHADTALRDSVDALSEQTGTAFTARGDGPLAGWSAQITAPQPKPTVTDREAFAAWWSEQGWPCEMSPRVEVIDHERAWAALTWRERHANDDPIPVDLTGLLDGLEDACKAYTEVILPEDAPAKAAAECDPTDDGGYVHRDSGEMVPGLEWRQQAPQLRVVGSKDAKAAGRRQVCDLLGINPAALGGDA